MSSVDPLEGEELSVVVVARGDLTTLQLIVPAFLIWCRPNTTTLHEITALHTLAIKPRAVCALVVILL